jgi:dTDP-4-amino-4,6-dideoxygalactose transaminase
MSVRIPLAKPDLGEEEAALARETILSGWVTQGPRVQEFEQKFAAYTGSPYAIAVSSCTTALHLALSVVDIGRDDEVIAPSHTFIATTNAIRYCGAKPVFVDIDPQTLNVDPMRVEAAITQKTKAILVVHQVGRPADLQSLKKIANTHKLHLIEDAACAAGSRYFDKPIGDNQYSELVCFSFHPRKIISTGDGGMITTNNKVYADRLKRLRQHGMSINDLSRHQATTIVTETYDELGYNYRMTDIQAAVGIVQLSKLPQLIARRRILAKKYDTAFVSRKKIQIFREPPDVQWNHQTYLIRIPDATSAQRDAIMQQLLEKGIATRRGIMSIHREPAYTSVYGHQTLTHSEQASDQCICLPLFSQMTDEEQDIVINEVTNAL